MRLEYVKRGNEKIIYIYIAAWLPLLMCPKHLESPLYVRVLRYGHIFLVCAPNSQSPLYVRVFVGALFFGMCPYRLRLFPKSLLTVFAYSQNPFLASSPIPKMMGNPPTQHVRAGSRTVRQIDTFQDIREIDVCLKAIRAVCRSLAEYSRLTVRQVGMASTRTYV